MKQKHLLSVILILNLAASACAISTAPLTLSPIAINNPASTPTITPGPETAPNPSATVSETPTAASAGTLLATQAGGQVVTINAVFPPMQAGDRNYEDFGSYILKSPLVDGINPPLVWSAIDKGPNAVGGQYQFETFDSEIQRFINAGKKVNLIVYPIGYSLLQAPPAYVLNDPALDKVSCTTPTFTNWPVVYEAPFKNAYKAFIAQVIQHFAGNPHIGYIRFGLSRGGEIYPFCAREEAALSKLSLADWGTQVWLPYDREMLEYEKSLNPPMRIMGPTTQFGTPDFADTEAENAIADGFGFGSQGMQKKDLLDYPNCTADWCNLFNQYGGRAALELQTYGQSDPSGVCGTDGHAACPGGALQEATGPLPPLITFAAAHHATILEIYTNDLLLALDPNYPGNAVFGTGYIQALLAVHGK